MTYFSCFRISEICPTLKLDTIKKKITADLLLLWCSFCLWYILFIQETIFIYVFFFCFIINCKKNIFNLWNVVDTAFLYGLCYSSVQLFDYTKDTFRTLVDALCKRMCSHVIRTIVYYNTDSRRSVVNISRLNTDKCCHILYILF